MAGLRSRQLLLAGVVSAAVVSIVARTILAGSTIEALVLGTVVFGLAILVDVRLTLDRDVKASARRRRESSRETEALREPLKGLRREHRDAAAALRAELASLVTALALIDSRTSELGRELLAAPWQPHYSASLRGQLDQLAEDVHAAKKPLAGLPSQRWLEQRLRHLQRQGEAIQGLTDILRPGLPLYGHSGWPASPDLIARLVREILTREPDAIIECGSGLSTVWMALALERAGQEGHVWSLDHDEQYAATTRKLLAEHRLEHRATVLHAPLMEQETDVGPMLCYRMDDLPPGQQFDMMLVDGPPESTQRRARYPALPMLLPRLRPGALILLDDALRDDERWTIDQWAERLGVEARIDTSYEKGLGILELGYPVA